MTLIGWPSRTSSTRAPCSSSAVRAAGGAALDAAVDAIRERYGTAAIMRAVLLGRRPGLAMPLLPD